MINLKFKRALFACALIAGLAGISSTSAQAVVVDAFANSSSGGSGGSTGVNLNADLDVRDGQCYPNGTVPPQYQQGRQRYYGEGYYQRPPPGRYRD